MPFDSALVSPLAALAGTLIGGAMSIIAVRVGKDMEGRQKREDVARRAANLRIKFLYEPLLRKMEPTPPYDDFYVDRELCRSITELSTIRRLRHVMA